MSRVSARVEQIRGFASAMIGEQRGAALPLVGGAIAEPCERTQTAEDERGKPGRWLGDQRARPQDHRLSSRSR